AGRPSTSRSSSKSGRRTASSCTSMDIVAGARPAIQCSSRRLYDSRRRLPTTPMTWTGGTLAVGIGRSATADPLGDQVGDDVAGAGGLLEVVVTGERHVLLVGRCDLPEDLVRLGGEH